MLVRQDLGLAAASIVEGGRQAPPGFSWVEPDFASRTFCGPRYLLGHEDECTQIKSIVFRDFVAVEGIIDPWSPGIRPAIVKGNRTNRLGLHSEAVPDHTPEVCHRAGLLIISTASRTWPRPEIGRQQRGQPLARLRALERS